LYKIIFISIIVLILGNRCTVSKNYRKGITELSSKDTKDILRITKNRNITNSSFFIEKGKIFTSGKGGNIKLLFTMKYKQPDIYLISLKSWTGIEALRVYIGNDTVLINDRINKITYFGKPFDFEKMTGLPAALLKVSVGDFFTGSGNEKFTEKCIENKVIVNDYFQGLIIRTIIDCYVGKTNSIILTSGAPDELINISYSKHKDDYYKIPGKVELNDLKRNVKIIIKIEKVSIPWDGEIAFIRGKGFTLKRLQ
jgi:hypothetical protein